MAALLLTGCMPSTPSTFPTLQLPTSSPASASPSSSPSTSGSPSTSRPAPSSNPTPSVVPSSGLPTTPTTSVPSLPQPSLPTSSDSSSSESSSSDSQTPTNEGGEARQSGEMATPDGQQGPLQTGDQGSGDLTQGSISDQGPELNRGGVQSSPLVVGVEDESDENREGDSAENREEGSLENDPMRTDTAARDQGEHDIPGIGGEEQTDEAMQAVAGMLEEEEAEGVWEESNQLPDTSTTQRDEALSQRDITGISDEVDAASGTDDEELQQALSRIDEGISANRSDHIDNANVRAANDALKNGRSGNAEDQSGDGQATILGGTSTANIPNSQKTNVSGELETALPARAKQADKDIPDAKDDDVVARQLREAAIAETDPELKDALWEELRKYKGQRK